MARILLIGDSTACTMLPGLRAVGDPMGVQVENGAVVGCGVVSGEIAPRIVNGTNVSASSSTCQSRADAAQARALRAGRPNIVLWASTWERSSLVVGSGNHQKVVTPGSPQWYNVLRERMQQRVRQLAATGATVVMLTQPSFFEGEHLTGPTPQDKDFERLNALLTEFAAQTPHVRSINLSAHVCPSGPPCPLVVDGLDLRGDGAHYTSDGSLWVARWLMPQLGIAALDKPDNPLPAMTMVEPAPGTVLKGTRLLAAVPSFNVGVARASFEITGNSLHNADIGNALLSHGFRYLYWNTKSVPDATYTVRSVAYNATGDRSVSKGITVKVAN